MRSSTRRRSCSRSSRRSTGAASPSAPSSGPDPPPCPLSQRELPLRRDMDDLSDAIKAVEKNRAKYKLDDVELQRRRSAPLPCSPSASLCHRPAPATLCPGHALARSGIRSSAADGLRRDFVSETRAAIGKMKSAVQDATASSGGALSHTRNELLRGAPLSRLPRALWAALLRCRPLCASLLRRMAAVAQAGQIEVAGGLAAAEVEGVVGTATQRATWRAAAPRSSSSSS